MEKRPSANLEARRKALRTMIGARAILRKRDSWFGGDEMANGPSCALMAINEVNGLGAMNDYQVSDELAACMILDEANRRHDPRTASEKRADAASLDGEDEPFFGDIPSWNDFNDGAGHTITKNKVLRVFTSVIKKLYLSLPEKHRKEFEREI